MNTVFIGGSRHVSRLPEEARERLKNIVSGKHRIIIGDAKGADAAVQKHLSSISYSNVVVYCSGEKCRNNIGRWKTNNISAPKKETGFQFYAIKDREMAREADFGYMIWDGESPGTLLNVLRLLLWDKKAVLLNTESKETKTFKSLQDWHKFISQADPILVDSLRRRATPEEWPENESSKQISFLADHESDDSKPEVGSHFIEVINRALEKGDSASTIEALGRIAKQRGMTELARACGLARESLYRSLSSEGNPEFATILKVLQEIGLKLMVRKG
jgi:probable addiction module antidote protein